MTCDSQIFSWYYLSQPLCVFPPRTRQTVCCVSSYSSSFQVSAFSLPMTVFVFKSSSSSSSSATDLLKFSRLSSGELRRWIEEEERSIEKSLAKRVAVKLPPIPPPAPPSGLPACLSSLPFSRSPSFTCWERRETRINAFHRGRRLSLPLLCSVVRR